MAFALLILTLSPIFILIYGLYSRHRARSLLSDCGFPVVPDASPLSGCLDSMVDGAAPWHYGRLSAIYGRTFGIMNGGVPTVVTSDIHVVQAISQSEFGHFHGKAFDPTAPDPNLDEAVHVFHSSGERWKRIRSVTSSAMTTGNLQKLFPLVFDSATRYVARLGKQVEEGVEMEMHHSFQNLTSDVVARCAFGQQESRLDNNRYLQLFDRAFGAEPKLTPRTAEYWMYLFPCLLPLTRWLCSVWSRLSSLGRSAAIHPLQQYTQHLANLRDGRRKGETRPDFLQTFKDAECDLFDYTNSKNDGFVDIAQTKTQRRIAPGEIAAQCRFLSIAGFDTTANTLAIAVHLLSMNPREQDTLYSELSTLPEGDPTLNSLHSLPYLHAVICETLRLFPHASPLQHRRCLSTVRIKTAQEGTTHGGTTQEGTTHEGILFRAGVSIHVDTWTIHRDKSIWGEDADEFRPERFLHPRTPSQLLAWQPFGKGPRMCVGMRFALMEVKTTLCLLLREFQALPGREKEVSLSLRDTGTIWPKGVHVRWRRRE